MKPPDKPGKGKNALEWSVFALSCLLIAGVVSMLGVEAWRTEDEPALLVAEIGQVELVSGWTHVPVIVTNQGSGVATNVQVMVTGRTPDREWSGTLSIDHVPRHASHRGRVSFAAHIAKEDIGVRMIGYEED